MILFILVGITTLAMGHHRITSQVADVDPVNPPQETILSATEAANQRDSRRGVKRQLEMPAGVHPLKALAEARILHASALPSASATAACANPDVAFVEEIVSAARSNRFAEVSDAQLGPDEVEALQHIAHD